MSRAGGAKRLFGSLSVALAFAALTFSTTDARASLTSSERAQIRDFVASARMENAGRVRSLVARTDLTVEESAGALVHATRPVAFTPQRAQFFREMAFATSSAASRPVLARALVRGLLARADAVHHQFVGGLDHEPRAIAELSAIYAFIDQHVANAGKPTAVAADGGNGISRAAYEDCAAALSAHVDTNRRWLKGSGAVPASVAVLRTQAQVALLDLTPHGTMRYVEVAQKLDLSKARRDLLVRHGLLLADAGATDDARVSRLGGWLDRLPDGHKGASVLYSGPSARSLRARGAIMHAPAAAPAYPFGEEVSPGTWDASLAALLLPVVHRATLASMGARATFGSIAQRDAAATHGDPTRVLGRPRAPSADHVVAAAVLALVVDGRRAVDSAFARYLVGRREPAALLSDALGVLAAQLGGAAKVDVGAPDGTAELTKVKVAASGEVTSFALDGSTFALSRVGPAFAVGDVTRNGGPLVAAHLTSGRVPVAGGASWSEGGLAFTRLRGAPRVGMVAGGVEAGGRRTGPTVRLVGTGASGLDAIGAPAPADDVTLEADLDASGGRGGIVLRATSAKGTVSGVALLASGQLELVLLDDKGAETQLAPAIPRPTLPAHVVMKVKGSNVEVTVGGKTLRGKLPNSVRRGQVAVVAARGASVQLAHLAIRK